MNNRDVLPLAHGLGEAFFNFQGGNDDAVFIFMDCKGLPLHLDAVARIVRMHNP